MKDTIVLYPSPGRGHLFSMVELGKLILKHHPSISVTVMFSTLPTETISLDDPYFATVSNTKPSITFIHLPQVSLPPMTSFSPLDFVASFFELPELNNTNLHQTLLDLSKSSNIKALVIDFFCSAAYEFVSSRLSNIPIYFFFTSGASSLSLFLYMPTLDKNITKSLKDLDILIDCHGIPKIPSKEMPLAMSDRSHKVYQYFVDTAKKMIKSAGLIINSFELLEPKALQAIQEGKCTPNDSVPSIFCVGPLLNSSETKTEHDCLTWLDSQPSRSVLFLCFGSLGVFNSRQLKEMAIGLEKSGVRFLWVVRTPLSDSQTIAIKSSTSSKPCLESLLPEGFLDRTKDRGFIVNSWAPQVAILNHGSVGGFVTHCGWNSILEALCAGVPMIAWPLYAEQKMNRIFLVEEMKVALALREAKDDQFVNAVELEERVIELMNSKKGEAVRERAMQFSEGAMVAKSDRGSSSVAMAKLVDSFQLG
ncbi:unnamed protein product [Dovyalis caffra]|uniref:Glycosyltransferase n=1 Tax=Dovyalis caffra TaxID=77055 RepID=A0AAV1QX02_9ROSI|nr:unnamed protein product [Dovyalis caffra]